MTNPALSLDFTTGSLDPRVTFAHEDSPSPAGQRSIPTEEELIAEMEALK